MAPTYTAQMSQRAGRWRVYVVVFGETWWPESDFAYGQQVPTRAERSRALNALGYALTDGAEWRWTEDSHEPGNPSSAVVLIAAATVEEVPE
jgi:uncharacterized protein DUF6303